MSPTKVITAIEGGVLTTNYREFAAKIKSMRDYGKGPDGQEMIYNGLSARPGEMHAAVALSGMRKADKLVKARRRLIGMYRARLGNLLGCRVQEYPNDRETSGNYFTLLIGPDAKVDRNTLYETLKSNDIQSKKYFYPPVHLQKAFVKAPGRTVGDLRTTIEVTNQSLALPLFSHMDAEQLDQICGVVINGALSFP